MSSQDNIPTRMTAIGFEAPGGPEVLVPQERPVPEPNEGQVLIKVAFAGVNRPDCLQRMGAYPPPPGAPDIPGLEVSGTVVSAGGGVDDLVGSEVTALVPGGGYGQYVLAPADNCLSVPNGLSLEQAAAIPETFFTVWHNVFQRGGLKDGEHLLVHGGTSGIGTTAVQLAKAFGATVTVTAGSDGKCQACLDLGADHAINYKSEDFVARGKDITGGKGMDLILDMVGGSYVERNYDLAAMDGRVVQIAFLGGAKSEVNFGLLMRKRLTHTGSTLRPRDVAFKKVIADELMAQVWPMIEAGKIAPVMDSTFALEDAAKAHARMEESNHVGKIMLKVHG